MGQQSSHAEKKKISGHSSKQPRNHSSQGSSDHSSDHTSHHQQLTSSDEPDFSFTTRSTDHPKTQQCEDGLSQFLDDTGEHICVIRSTPARIDRDGNVIEDESGGKHWGTKLSYVNIPLKQRLVLTKITLQVRASDQQWGNTGYSYVNVMVMDATDTEVCTDRVAVVTHDIEDYQYEAHLDTDIVKAANKCPNGTLNVVLESAPYPGWECRGYYAALTITIGISWSCERQLWMGVYAPSGVIATLDSIVMNKILSFLDGRPA
jgi:hypothetical protein